jgi:hypothetical protein
MRRGEGGEREKDRIGDERQEGREERIGRIEDSVYEQCQQLIQFSTIDTSSVAYCRCLTALRRAVQCSAVQYSTMSCLSVYRAMSICHVIIF